MNTKITEWTIELEVKEVAFTVPLLHRIRYWFKENWWGWHVPFGIELILPWPSNTYTADPNDLIRPYLEKHIGRQFIWWDWKVCIKESPYDNHLCLKIIGHKKEASYIALRWG